MVAPAEAKVSGFMEAPAETAAPAQDAARLATVIDQPVVASTDFSVPVGAWVELLVNGRGYERNFMGQSA